MAKTILIVDDEQDILDLLQFNLETEGYNTLTATDGLSALRQAKAQKPDLVVLDIMLPEKDGLQVIRELREDADTKSIPVIFLTAKDSEFDEVLGLELGADDYIVKPISIRKLLARIKTVLRKTAVAALENEPIIRFADVEIDIPSYLVRVAGKPVAFTKKEFEVLAYLARKAGKVVTRDTLLNEIWGDDVVVIDRTIDVHIRKIREKLGEQNMHMIETIKGVGYRLRAEA